MASQEGNAVQPYLPSTHCTASQADRASNGDVDTRLGLITETECEEFLGSIYNDSTNSESALDRLNKAEGVESRVGVLRELLETLGDATEKTAKVTTYLWRWAALNNVFDGHPSATLRDPESFLGMLEHRDFVSLNIALGTSTVAAKRGALLIIRDAWGDDWFNRIPGDKQFEFDCPVSAPKRVLNNIAGSCRLGLSLDEAIRRWDVERTKRLRGEGRRPGHNLSRSQKIVGADILTVNEAAEPRLATRRAAEVFDLHEDALKVNVGPKAKRKSKSYRNGGGGGGQSEGSTRKKKKKRVHIPNVEDLLGPEELTLVPNSQEPPPSGQRERRQRACPSRKVLLALNVLLAACEGDDGCCRNCDDVLEDLAETFPCNDAERLVHRLQSCSAKIP